MSPRSRRQPKGSPLIEQPWELHEGDCRPWLASLADKSVDHVITDPPYENEAHTRGRREKVSKDGVLSVVKAPLPFEAITADMRRTVAAEFARVARRWVLVFCQIEAAMLWVEALRPLVYKRTCLWVKPDGQPQLSGDRPGMGYECIVACHPKGRSRWNGGGKLGVFTHVRMAGSGGAKNPHPTTKPLPLMLELVSLFTDPDELVLDPFAGSATTGVAALRLGRRFMGAELSPTWAKTCRDRLAAEQAHTSLAAVQRGQTSLFGT